jgi:glycosyltransferase involved in cell wall biosynthesis
MDSSTMTSTSPCDNSGARPRILFVHSKATRFVRDDLEILSDGYRVVEWYQKNRFVNVVSLWRAVRTSDLVFGWFASWHTFIPAIMARFMNRPSVYVVGGYDTANMPEIGYGSQRGGIRRWVARTVMRCATTLITHSNFTRTEAIQNARVDPAKIHTVYLGVSIPVHRQLCVKVPLVVTVGNVDECNLKRKGLEPFVRAAAGFPDMQFALIGRWLDNSVDFLRSIASPNLMITGEVTDEELARFLDRAMVYVQASAHEGFGLALAEAMLAECVPVVTPVGSLPEVVGDAGIFVASAEPEPLTMAIQKAMEVHVEYGKKAREHIVTEFSPEKRRDALCRIVREALTRGNKGTTQR